MEVIGTPEFSDLVGEVNTFGNIVFFFFFFHFPTMLYIVYNSKPERNQVAKIQFRFGSISDLIYSLNLQYFSANSLIHE